MSRAIRRANAKRAKLGLPPLSPGIVLSTWKNERHEIQQAARNGLRACDAAPAHAASALLETRGR